MMKQSYSCNICLDPVPNDKLDGQLFGCRFVGPHNFKLGPARSTDGQHICLRCLMQINE